MPIIKSLRLHSVLFYSSLYHPFTSAPCLTELNLLGFGELALPLSQLAKVLRDSKKLKTNLSQLQNVEELRMGQIDVLPYPWINVTQS
jgi:hypothetical protein